jgi:hypothetical protein
MALVSTQPLTEIKGIFLRVNAGQRIKLTTSPSSVSRLSRSSDNPIGLHGLLQGYLYLIVRRIFVPKRAEVIGGCRKLHPEELHNLYSLPSIIRMLKSRMMEGQGM